MSGRATIYPTHTCFDDALEFFALMMDEDELLDTHARYRVAHGVCRGSWEGEPFIHAWVEQLAPTPAECLAWQAGTLDRPDGAARVYFALPLAEFYGTFRVVDCKVYTLARAARCNLDTGHHGPWDPQYFELCRRHGDGRILGQVDGPAPVAIRAVPMDRWRALQLTYQPDQTPPPPPPTKDQ